MDKRNTTKICFKIYEGCSSLKRNINASLENKFKLGEAPAFKNQLLNREINKFKKLNIDIYVWAGIDKINVNENDWVGFYNEKYNIIYAFQFLEMVPDGNEEIYHYMDWTGWKDRKKWCGVVFLKNRNIIDLSKVNDRENIIKIIELKKDKNICNDEANTLIESLGLNN